MKRRQGGLTIFRLLLSLCREQNIKVLVDAVSSFGAEEIDLKPRELVHALHAPINVYMLLLASPSSL